MCPSTYYFGSGKMLYVPEPQYSFLPYIVKFWDQRTADAVQVDVQGYAVASTVGVAAEAHFHRSYFHACIEEFRNIAVACLVAEIATGDCYSFRHRHLVDYHSSVDSYCNNSVAVTVIADCGTADG